MCGLVRSADPISLVPGVQPPLLELLDLRLVPGLLRSQARTFPLLHLGQRGLALLAPGGRCAGRRTPRPGDPAGGGKASNRDVEVPIGAFDVREAAADLAVVEGLIGDRRRLGVLLGAQRAGGRLAGAGQSQARDGGSVPGHAEADASTAAHLSAVGSTGDVVRRRWEAGRPAISAAPAIAAANPARGTRSNIRSLQQAVYPRATKA